jgi:hypothetical protein
VVSYRVKELVSGASPQAPKPQGAPVTGPQRGNAEAHYFGPVENGDTVLLIPRRQQLAAVPHLPLRQAP